MARIYKFERDKYGMNGCENLMICHFETGCLEGYTCAPPLDPQTFFYIERTVLLKG
jgi:hypothetical protein